ncbi:MAG: allantoate deiminase [Verrucomicrobiota bacterium]|jgi:allantoate deiminase
MRTDAELAAQVMQRIDALAEISEVPGGLTRTYGSPSMHRANEAVSGWMREAGMTTRVDAIGNLCGRYEGAKGATQTFLLGSHLDTVRDAGRFDGALGVITAIACVQCFAENGRRLPFAIEILAFADEEGVRFHSTYLGSRALCGVIGEADLQRTDRDGVCLEEAIRKFGGDPAALKTCRRDPSELLGYAEVHIEQGPVLQDQQRALGVVWAIAGQTRLEASFAGRAAHAGTTPMGLREDALVAAARFIRDAQLIARQHPGLVVTVGQIEAHPGASNVIPGFVKLSVDVRHPEDAVRCDACELLAVTAAFGAAHERVELGWNIIQATRSITCSPELTALLTESIGEGKATISLCSGAGHDAATLAAITPVVMLFVRCKDGISHHCDESVHESDVEAAIRVMGDFLQRVAQRHA